MAKRCYYEVLGLSRGAGDGESKPRFAGSPRNAIPTATAIRPPRRSFKEFNEAYEALKDPQRRAAYDRFGHAAFDGGWAAAAAATASAPISRPRCRRCSTICSASSWAARAPAPALGARARRRPSLQHGDHPRRGLRGQDRADPGADLRHLRRLLGLRRQGRHAARRLPDLWRASARCAPARASSPSSAPARPARDAAR